MPWLMLVYKIPREPTAARVSVWRKLKRLGAHLLHDAVWVLPETPRTREQFQWLTAEIVELGGEATLLHGQPLGAKQEAGLVRHFQSQADRLYDEIDAALRGKALDLAALSRSFQQAAAVDFFQSKRGPKVRAALLAAERHRRSTR